MTKDDFKTLEQFVKERYEPTKRWKNGALLDYIYWAAESGFLITAREKDGDIVGAALARPIAKLQQTEKEYEFDRDGRICHIDFMVTANKQAFLLLGFTILDIYKQCEAITFQRFNKGNKNIKIYNPRHVRSTLFKLRN